MVSAEGFIYTCVCVCVCMLLLMHLFPLNIRIPSLRKVNIGVKMIGTKLNGVCNHFKKQVFVFFID